MKRIWSLGGWLSKIEVVKLQEVNNSTRFFRRCLFPSYCIQHVRSSSSGNIDNTQKTSDEFGDLTRHSLEERKRAARLYSILIASAITGLGSLYIYWQKKKKALAEPHKSYFEQPSNETKRDVESTYEQEENHERHDGSVHLSLAGFKERKVIQYENRLRQYSTPDKLFRYFATLQDAETGTIYMTPDDFVRALTPNIMQPPGLDLDKFKKFDAKRAQKYVSRHFGEDSVFYAFGESGLISFTDYVFLVTVIGTSTRHIHIAFKMFDINGDGEVTFDEFKKVHLLFLALSSTGSRHRDRKTTGNVLSEMAGTGLMETFFGSDGRRKLTVQEFVSFQRRLQKEVMRLEFSNFNPIDGRISERSFSEILLTYADFTYAAKKRILKRIDEKFGKESENSDGITFDDYENFFEFLLNMRDVEMALSFHTVAGRAIDRATFKQVAQTVAGVNLRDHLVDVVFCLFDANNDGVLQNKEFIAVMKDKMFRGLNKPRDTGFTRLLSAIYTCGKMHVADAWSSS